MPWYSILNQLRGQQHNPQEMDEQNLIVNPADNERRQSNDNNGSASRQQPRVASFMSGVNHFFIGIRNFFSGLGIGKRGSYTLIPQVIGAQAQAENRILLSEILGSQRPDFNACIKNACAKASKELSFVQPRPNIDGAVQNALLTIHRSPSSVPYTQNSLEKDLCTALKEICIKPHITQALEFSLKQANVACDEGSMATLLQAHALGLKQIAVAQSNQMPNLCQKLVHTITNQACSLKNYTDAKKEATQKACTMLATQKGQTIDEVTQSPEIKILTTALDKSALELEEHATVSNGGELPLVSKAEYDHIFNGVITKQQQKWT